MKYAYIRHAPYAKTQIKQLVGIAVDATFTDEAEASDETWPWPQLQALLDTIKEGDIVYVKSLDRISRNVGEVADLTSKFIQVNASLHVIDTGVQIAKESSGLLSILNTLKKLEVAISKEVKEETKPGPKRQLTESQAAEIRKRAEAGEMVSKLAREYGVSRAVLYQKYDVKRK